jgi:hypothetical protein
VAEAQAREGQRRRPWRVLPRATSRRKRFAGAAFQSCGAALAGAGVKLNDDKTLTLSEPFDSATIEVADGQVVMVNFKLAPQSAHKRKAFVDWLKGHLPGSAEVGEADGNIGCGADSGGPAWTSVKNGEPEVQFAIATFPKLLSTSHANMEDLVEKTKTNQLDICFRMAKKGAAYMQPIYSLIRHDRASRR